MNRESNPYQHTGAFPRPPQSLAARIFTFLLTAILIILALMFSLVALAVAVVGGLLFAGWFWWKTRALRKAMRADAPIGKQPPRGDFIDGECIRETPDDRLLR